MTETKINQIGKVVIIEFETQQESEAFYNAFIGVYEIIREAQEKARIQK